MPDLPAVGLRPLTSADVAALEATRTPDADPFNWAGYQDAGALAAAITQRATLREESGDTYGFNAVWTAPILCAAEMDPTGRAIAMEAIHATRLKRPCRRCNDPAALHLRW